MPTPWSSRSIPRPGAFTPASPWPSPAPAGCRRPIRTCRTFRSAPRKAAASAAPSSPSPGNVLVSADYSQIELRLLAHVADIPALKRELRHGEDIHARTASEVFGVPMQGMDPMTRRRAKAINFGIIYGISAFGLARQLRIEPGEARATSTPISPATRHPRLHGTHQGGGAHRGYVLTPFGRRCWIPGIADKNPARRG